MGYVFEAMQNSSDGERERPGIAPNVFDEDASPSAAVSDVAEADPIATDAAAPSPLAETGTSVGCRLDERLVMATAPRSGHAEAFRRLASRVHASVNGRPGVHALTSATRKEGKTISSANLSMALAELTRRPTLLIDGDLRAAHLQRLFRLDHMPCGLTQVLAGEVEIDDAIVRPEGTGIALICAGSGHEHGDLSLINTRDFVSLIEQLRNRFDQIVVDTPPVLDVADAGALCSAVDQVMLVIRMNQTHRQLVHDAITTIRSYNQNLGGLVLTDVQPHAMAYGRRYMYGSYGYGHNRRRQTALPVETLHTT